MALPVLAGEVRGLAAAARGAAARSTAAAAVAVPRRGRDAALADALVTVGEAVGREYGASVIATAVVDNGAPRLAPAAGR